jgi:hypothetical protein
MKNVNNSDNKQELSHPSQDENLFNADDNKFSNDDNDGSQDGDTIDENSYDPLLTEYDIPEETNKMSSSPLLTEYDIPEETNKMNSAPLACPPPIRTTLVEQCVKDEHQMTGQVIGTKLKNMDISQQIIAEKLISDVLYYGRLGMLEIDTRLQNLKISPT